MADEDALPHGLHRRGDHAAGWQISIAIEWQGKPVELKKPGSIHWRLTEKESVPSERENILSRDARPGRCSGRFIVSQTKIFRFLMRCSKMIKTTWIAKNRTEYKNLDLFIIGSSGLGSLLLILLPVILPYRSRDGP